MLAPPCSSPCVPGDCVKEWVGAPVLRQHDDAEREHQQQLDRRRDAEDEEHRPRPEEHERDDGDREEQFDQPAPRLDPREDVGEHLVDDVGDRVRQVEEVAERPDRGLNERHAPADRSLDERGEPARGDDLLAVAHPDEERERVQRSAERGHEPGGAHVARARHVDHRERERPPDRRDREAEIERRRNR